MPSSLAPAAARLARAYCLSGGLGGPGVDVGGPFSPPLKRLFALERSISLYFDRNRSINKVLLALFSLSLYFV
jgi:hypothetical protein